MLKKILKKLKSYLPVSRSHFNEVNNQNLKTLNDIFIVIEGVNEYEAMVRGDIKNLYDFVVEVDSKSKDGMKSKEPDKMYG